MTVQEIIETLKQERSRLKKVNLEYSVQKALLNELRLGSEQVEQRIRWLEAALLKLTENDNDKP